MTWEPIEDFAIEDKIAQLGEPTTEFAVRGLGFLRNMVLAPLLVVAGLALEIVLIGVLHVHQHELLILGIVMVLSGVMLVVRAFRNRGLRVLVFPEGLVRLHRGRAQAFCWEDVNLVWQKKSDASHSIGRAWQGALTLTVQALDGRRMSFDDSLPRLAELAQIVRGETLPFLWPRTRAAFDAGHVLDFGKLSISRQGLSQGKETFPWSDLQKVKVNGADLLIYKKGKRMHSKSTPISDIPNSHVLLALIEQTIPVERSSK
jgi:hypothetical protein